MDPLTLAVFVPGVALVLVLAGATAGRHVPKSYLEDVLGGAAGGTAMTRVWAMTAASVLGVLALMILFSVAIPALRNPLLLFTGALIAFALPRFWTGMTPWGRAAFVAGIALAIVWVVLDVILLTN